MTIDDYSTAKEIADKWGVSVRLVSHYCDRGLIEGAAKKGGMWLIPSNCRKPGMDDADLGEDEDEPLVIQEEEDHACEFKESWRIELLQWVCGLANADGGRLFIGVRDNGQVIGVKDSKKLMEDIPNAIVSAFGMYDVKVYLRHDGARKYIEIVVPKSRTVLEYKGVPYIKIGTTLQIMRSEMFRQTMANRGSLTWDAFTMDNVSIDDLDEESFVLFKREAMKANILSGVNLDDRFSILKQLDLIEDGKLTRAAVLLFHENPSSFFPGAYVQIGRFANEASLLYQKEAKGSLMSLGIKTIDILETLFTYGLISYDRTTRHETVPYPGLVIREAVYNAIMHNDWSAGSPILIKSFDFKLEISNRALLPADWSVYNHYSEHINPLISNAFRYAGFVEKFGTGIPKMMMACEAEGNPLPVFAYRGHTLTLSLKASERYMEIVDELYWKDRADQLSDHTPEYRINRKTSSSEESVYKSRKEKILDMLARDGSLTSAEMAERLSVANRTLERDLAALCAEGHLAREGSKKTGRWILPTFK